MAIYINKKNVITASIGAVGLGLVAYKAAGLTTVVVGKVAAAGAIKTSTLMTTTGPVVFSVVKASVFSKLICFAAGLVVAGAVTYFIHESLKNYDLDGAMKKVTDKLTTK